MGPEAEAATETGDFQGGNEAADGSGCEAGLFKVTPAQQAQQAQQAHQWAHKAQPAQQA